jgi:hypothetical protein
MNKKKAKSKSPSAPTRSGQTPPALGASGAATRLDGDRSRKVRQPPIPGRSKPLGFAGLGRRAGEGTIYRAPTGLAARPKRVSPHAGESRGCRALPARNAGTPHKPGESPALQGPRRPLHRQARGRRDKFRDAATTLMKQKKRWRGKLAAIKKEPAIAR